MSTFKLVLFLEATNKSLLAWKTLTDQKKIFYQDQLTFRKFRISEEIDLEYVGDQGRNQDFTKGGLENKFL